MGLGVDGPSMHCDNCDADDPIAYTLTTHVRGADVQVDLDFCSIDCLREWT